MTDTKQVRTPERLSVFPGYRFKGRMYRTVSGLSRALFSDSGCDSHSMVVDRRITCTVGRGPERRTVAVYAVSEPKPDEPMTVARAALAAAGADHA